MSNRRINSYCLRSHYISSSIISWISWLWLSVWLTVRSHYISSSIISWISWLWLSVWLTVRNWLLIDNNRSRSSIFDCPPFFFWFCFLLYFFLLCWRWWRCFGWRWIKIRNLNEWGDYCLLNFCTSYSLSIFSCNSYLRSLQTSRDGRNRRWVSWCWRYSINNWIETFSIFFKCKRHEYFIICMFRSLSLIWIELCKDLCFHITSYLLRFTNCINSFLHRNKSLHPLFLISPNLRINSISRLFQSSFCQTRIYIIAQQCFKSSLINTEMTSKRITQYSPSFTSLCEIFQ